MKIALLAPFEEAVPPIKYGGTELVVNNLAEELTKLGHEVTLFASGDSTIKVRLVAGLQQAIRVLPEARNPLTRAALNYEGLANTLKALSGGNFDILHNHFGWPTLLFKDLIPCPVVTTLHGSLAKESNRHLYHYFSNERRMYSKFREMPFVSISNAQRKHAPKLNYVATVHNGIMIDSFTFNNKPQDYLAFLGRIHPQKGPVEAIKLAKRTHNRLLIGAKIDPDDENYFHQKVEPLIDGKQIIFLGELNHKKKVDLLSKAKAILSPINWDEPFGLANIEAMACGTPVIGIARGSLPEIIKDSRTGFLCDNVREMAKAIKKIDSINRADCRRHVSAYFSSKHMAKGYVRVYEKLIS